MKKYASFFLTLIALALLTSCDDNDIEKRQVAFTATMPSDDLSFLRPGSIINGVPDGTGLSAHWKEGDKIQLFVRQDGKVYQVESQSTVSDISSDGKTCSFQVTLPKSVNRDKDYDIIGVTGVEAYIDGNDVIASCNLTRVGIDGNGELSFPMWFTAKKGSNQAKFRHICAYEVLSVNNNSDSSIRLRHGGFEVMTPWYRYNDKVALTDNAFSGYEAGQNDVQSNEITIDAWETGTIVSWYIPRFDVTDDIPGATINNAKLKAVVNGSTVTTIDALKAYKNFARGYAYYMQVIWDGSSLCFSNDFCPDGNHPHMIDLGLPSGTKWACCNVGANTPVEYGDYFAWGETAPKSAYLASNYKWYIGGDNNNISKYCTNSDYGTVDNRTELEPEDDAAYVNWGTGWRMPSLSQIYELLNNCTSEWTTVNGLGGYLFKSNINNRAIFFPAAGFYNNKGLRSIGTVGTYWSCIYSYNHRPDFGICIAFLYGNMGPLSVAYFYRESGATVRAVYVGQE